MLCFLTQVLKKQVRKHLRRLAVFASYEILLNEKFKPRGFLNFLSSLGRVFMYYFKYLSYAITQEPLLQGILYSSVFKTCTYCINVGEEFSSESLSQIGQTENA